MKIKVQAEDPDEPATKALMKRLGPWGCPCDSAAQFVGAGVMDWTNGQMSAGD